MPIENNQKKSNGRGGSRKGSGRKVGSATAKTRDIANGAAASGQTPLEYLLSVMRTSTDERMRMSAAQAAAPYVHAKLASVQVTGEGGGPVLIEAITRKIVRPK